MYLYGKQFLFLKPGDDIFAISIYMGTRSDFFKSLKALEIPMRTYPLAEIDSYFDEYLSTLRGLKKGHVVLLRYS
jgi:hypothetical protein